jgi:hypothetical protein
LVKNIIAGFNLFGYSPVRPPSVPFDQAIGFLSVSPSSQHCQIYGCRPWELCGALKQEFDFDAMLFSNFENAKSSLSNNYPIYSIHLF